MTRFARAKGSKASNERRPEEATSWQDMRKQLEINQLQNTSKTGELPVEVKSSWKHKIVNDSAHEQNENSVWTSFNDGSNQELVKKKKRKSEIIGKSSTDNKVVKLTTNSENKLEESSVVKKKKKKESFNKDVKLTMENESKPKYANIGKKKKKKKNFTSVEVENPCQDSEITFKNEESLNLNVEKESNNNNESVKTKKEKFYNRKGSKKNKKNNGEGKEILKNTKEQGKVMNENDNSFLQSDKMSNSEVTSNNKKHKNIDNNSYKRRKPNPGNYTAYINGKTIEIVCYEGFFIKSEDAENLRKLKKQLIKKGIPRNELQAVMKLERRKAEKALAREKKKVCFHCRKSGHNLSECPELQGTGSATSGLCFKCGSTEHTYFECKVSHGEDFRFAQCFICKEEGHIAKQCPDNPRGLYPKGGACRVCGDVTHMKRDCPNLKQTSEQAGVTAKIITKGRSLDVLDEELNQVNKPIQRPNKKIKFF